MSPHFRIGIHNSKVLGSNPAPLPEVHHRSLSLWLYIFCRSIVVEMKLGGILCSETEIVDL